MVAKGDNPIALRIGPAYAAMRGIEVVSCRAVF
jgi:hypothetical protein